MKWISLAARFLMLLVFALPATFLWIVYGAGRLLFDRPPIVLRLTQVRRYLRLTWTVQPSQPGLNTFKRCVITLRIVNKLEIAPVAGLAWMLDECLYGRKLRETPLVSPLIEISAGRSGSTQIARYLEDDERLAAPSLLQITFPYLWLWKLAPMTLGRIFSPEKVRLKIEAMLSPEFLERHEVDPFRTDTFDSSILTQHLNSFAVMLGPDVFFEEMHFARFAPHNQRLWEEDFVNLLDGIGRKVMLNESSQDGTSPKRFFVKGHFLSAANALEARYSDAAFITVIRQPAARLRSAINYLRVNPHDRLIGPPPWEWLSEALLRTESEYCQVEQEWFTRNGGATRCVIRFSDYVNDLTGTMEQIYRECFNGSAPYPAIPKEHPPRERKSYRVNRTLSELGIDEAELHRVLAAYCDWCQPAPDKMVRHPQPEKAKTS